MRQAMMFLLVLHLTGIGTWASGGAADEPGGTFKPLFNGK